MHSNISPSVSKRCIGCGICVQNCNADAIKIVDNKAEIDNDKCEGCAMCIAVCPNGAVKVPWHGDTSEGLQRKIVDYAHGVIKFMKEKIIFINVLENITKDCDCMGFNQKMLAEDIGILAGDDVVAIDKASVDLANKKGKFGNEDAVQINYAFEKQLGEKEYEIIDLDNL